MKDQEPLRDSMEDEIEEIHPFKYMFGNLMKKMDENKMTVGKVVEDFTWCRSESKQTQMKSNTNHGQPEQTYQESPERTDQELYEMMIKESKQNAQNLHFNQQMIENKKLKMSL